MAVPALKLELEKPVEERITRLEVNVEHITSDVADLKSEVRRVNDKIDGAEQRLSDKIDAVDKKQSARSDSLAEALAKLTLTVEKAFADAKLARAYDRVWWLLMSGALLSLMARALHWI